MFDQELRLILVTGQAVAREGFDPLALEGRLLAEALPADRWAFWEPIYRAALEGEATALEMKGKLGDRWYQVDVNPWRDGEEGRPRGGHIDDRT